MTKLVFIQTYCGLPDDHVAKECGFKKGTISKTRSSVTPLTPNSNVKKSHFSSARPTRPCTLTNRPLYTIDDSDSEGEYTVFEGSYKQYSKKKVIKSEPGVLIKTEPLDTDDQKKTQYPRTYPNKTVLIRRSAHLKPKSSVFKVHSNKFNEVDIFKPVTLKQPLVLMDTSSDAKNSFFEASQAVKNIIFDTNVHGRISLHDPNIPSCSTKDLYDHNIPSTSKSNFYENSLPSTSKSVYNSEYDVNSVLICEETIPGSPTGMSEKQYEQERKKAFQTLDEEREAASAMYAMSQSLCRPMITLMGATEEEMEEYTNILKKDGEILDQQNLLLLAEISSKQLGININEPSVTELLEREPETIVEKITMPQEKLQFKCKISSHEQTSKLSKLSTATAPIPSVSHVEELDEEEELKSVLANPVFPPEMISAQKQAYIIDRMNYLQREYVRNKARLVVLDRRKKKINKREKEQAKAARQAASRES